MRNLAPVLTYNFLEFHVMPKPKITRADVKAYNVKIMKNGTFVLHSVIPLDYKRFLRAMIPKKLVFINKLACVSVFYMRNCYMLNLIFSIDLWYNLKLQIRRLNKLRLFESREITIETVFHIQIYSFKKKY